MSDLKSFVALQARVYAFLEQQDEATLQAIVGGTARLAVLGSDEAPSTPSRPATPSADPQQAARDLATLQSEDERRIYLNSSGMTVEKLIAVAKAMGRRKYSGLNKPKLIALLASRASDQAVSNTSKPSPPAPSESTGRAARASEEAPVTAEPARSNVDVATIASHLRELETEEEGTTYLREQRLDRETLLAVAAELQLTRVTRLTPSELEKRVLKQAIGARRKFAGLRKW